MSQERRVRLIVMDLVFMKETQLNNPLHGMTLEGILNALVLHYGWDGLGQQIDIRCFNFEPSIASSLKFLRRTPWARTRVESLYVNMVKQQASHDSTRDKPQ